MRKYLASLIAACLMCGSASVLAGPAEDVAELSARRIELLERGDAAGHTLAFADNAVFHSALSPFGVEGKSAIRAYFVQLFQIYPNRKVFVRQPTVRVYGEDLVVQNDYSVAYLTDSAGKVRVLPSRASTVWSKTGGKWQIVEQHVSPLPTAE